MQPLSRQNVAFDQRVQGPQGGSTGAYLIGQCRQAQLHAFATVTLALAVSGWCWPNFSNRIIARREGPAKPRGVT